MVNNFLMTGQPKFTRSIQVNEKKHHLHCAHMCKNIYHKKEDVLMNKYNNSLYVAIEGTDTAVNWIDNVSFAFKTNDVHRGFQRYANYCLTEYDPLNEIDKFDSVTICGHSLGSASATLMAYQLCKEAETNDVSLPSRVELVLFGCPKIGGKAFTREFTRLATKMGLIVTSYQNEGDIVCSIPFGYLGYINTFTETNTRLLKTTYKPFWDVSNHYISTYIDI